MDCPIELELDPKTDHLLYLVAQELGVSPEELCQLIWKQLKNS
jgi:hypothetical protein